MNKRQKEVALTSLNEEKKIFKALEVTYKQALKDIGEKIKVLQADDTQSKIYQLEYQKSLKKQIENILDVMNDNNYTKIYDFLKTSYNIGYIGSIYDIAGQGIPLIIPIDQKKMVMAIVNESKIKEGLYKTVVSDTKWLKGRISAEVSRGIATNISYNDIARNLDNTAKIGLNRAKRIARTEGHRVTQSAAFIAQKEAQKAGTDVVKQWDATLDGRTRDTHRLLDGQIKEIDEPFEVAGKKAMFPSDFGDPAEDCNCRCVCLQRARWALDEDELVTLKNRASFFELDKTDSFEDYKEKYLGVTERVRSNVQKINSKLLEENGNSGKIKSITIDDFVLEIMGKDISEEMQTAIYSKIRELEKNGGFAISEIYAGSLKNVGNGKPLFQIESTSSGVLKLNINTDIVAGRSVEEINQIIKGSKKIVADNIDEVLIHESGHAKTIAGMNVFEIDKIYKELSDIHIEGISEYAYLDGAECIAEVEVLLSRGEKVPKKAMDLYNKYIKRR